MRDDLCNDAYNDDDDDNVGAVESISVIDCDYLCDTDDDYYYYYYSVTICDMIWEQNCFSCRHLSLSSLSYSHSLSTHYLLTY